MIQNCFDILEILYYLSTKFSNREWKVYAKISGDLHGHFDNVFANKLLLT